MIDVSSKFNTLRYAKAKGCFYADEKIITRIKEKNVPKGDVLQVARAAGISSGKRASDTIVFCHTIPIDWIDISFELYENKIEVFAEAKAVWKTGVEMEVMAAVSAALLNIYDMTKPLSADLKIGEIELVKKKGGKSDFTDKFSPQITAAVLVLSDSTFEGTRKDKSGKIIKEFLEHQDVNVKSYDILPDDVEKISAHLIQLIDDDHVQLIITTGGTGLGPRDVTPEATKKIIQKEIPGISEAIRKHGKERTPFAMLSRELAGIRNESIIINMPGSSKGAKESMDAIFPGVLHLFPMLWGGSHDKMNHKNGAGYDKS